MLKPRMLSWQQNVSNYRDPLISFHKYIKFYLILTSNVWMTFDLNIEQVELLLVTLQFCLRAQNAQFSFRIVSQDFPDFESSYLWNGNRYQQTVKTLVFNSLSYSQ